MTECSLDGLAMFGWVIVQKLIYICFLESKFFDLQVKALIMLI